MNSRKNEPARSPSETEAASLGAPPPVRSTQDSATPVRSGPDPTRREAIRRADPGLELDIKVVENLHPSLMRGIYGVLADKKLVFQVLSVEQQVHFFWVNADSFLALSKTLELVLAEVSHLESRKVSIGRKTNRTAGVYFGIASNGG